MVDVNSVISIITLNVNGLKVETVEIGSKKKMTQLDVVYKKPILDVKAHID